MVVINCIPYLLLKQKVKTYVIAGLIMSPPKGARQKGEEKNKKKIREKTD